MFAIPTFSSAKLIGFGLGALALIGFLAWINNIKNERNELRQWRDQIITAIQSEVPVDHRKSVTTKTAGDEIHWLGREYRTASSALETQSRQLEQAKRETEAAQDSAALAAKRALDADKGRKVVRDRLTAPSRSGGLSEDEWKSL